MSVLAERKRLIPEMKRINQYVGKCYGSYDKLVITKETKTNKWCLLMRWYCNQKKNNEIWEQECKENLTRGFELDTNILWRIRTYQNFVFEGIECIIEKFSKAFLVTNICLFLIHLLNLVCYFIFLFIIGSGIPFLKYEWTFEVHLSRFSDELFSPWFMVLSSSP